MSSTQGTWDTGEQIREHKLACSVINLHGTEDAVFDDNNFNLLKQFTNNMSNENRDAILRENGWVDEPGSRPGMKAATQSQSLSGLLIARYGTDEPALDDRDWELLKGWFDRGMPTGEHVRR
ncbi:hypothetical protein LTR10_018450 [Elasticomyces elasticus]|uniref:Uncharacterized protein n=1 Tax=Exophiala sideris TaxID=1016849 RepID=A0ABR0J782_9EURO|nr:hypothetical protein LTR10_018450 [Elasticomyces elasticus]KAK5029490.1 hypothetical protein LTS07_005952 [Exophiala sideris]KAK5036813.1 hypothetical protein LTR13_005193 [Exophiala sideris]KAK5058120.1 hypothetical protein LTR69_007117 [Exophiala sideris]KAK5182079.1 hypothetical protein LTR44_005680 [Eurotiomycetes sp. CCFEE 6388]